MYASGKGTCAPCALRTLISSKDHPSRWIAAECMALLIQKAPSFPKSLPHGWFVRDGALECLWSTASDEDELPSWLYP